MNVEELRLYLNIAASGVTLMAFMGIGVKPIRNRVSKWLGELFTSDIKAEMVTQIGILRGDISKDRLLAARRHRTNVKELKKIAFGLQVSNARMDEHEEAVHGRQA